MSHWGLDGWLRLCFGLVLLLPLRLLLNVGWLLCLWLGSWYR
jgi:hypothetical protein